MSDFHLLSSLSPLIRGWSICVKVIRVYKIFVNSMRFVLALILVDENGTRIEARVDPTLSPFYFERIREGEWKSITTFRVCNNSDSLRATSHQFGIQILDTTVVTNAYPRNEIIFNNFTPFAYIIEDTVDTAILVDLVGALVEVGELTNVSSNQNDIEGFKLPFKIKDRFNDVLNCEALSLTAIDFDNNYRNYGRLNMVVALGWWRVHRYFSGVKNVTIKSYKEISKVFPEPDISERDEINMLL